MATKQVKKVTTHKIYQTSGSENSDHDSSFRGRSSSPARVSRLQEKEQLTTLNDRLAAYIDHIRSLESENEKLHTQVKTFEETTKREVSSVKDLYDKELAAARKLIDDLSKENAQLTISVGTYKSESEEWMRKYTHKDRELSNLQKKLADLENQLADANANLAAANRELLKAKDDSKKAHADIVDLERQLASARKQLEEETLAKVDLENKVQSLKEELAFKSQLHQSELNETRTRMEYTMEEVDTRTQKEMESRLQEALADFRRQHEIQTQIHREELESLYEAKITGLQKELESQDGMDERVRTEVSHYKSRVSELQSQIAKLANQNATLEARVASLEADLAAERDQFRSVVEAKDREIRLIRQQMDEQMREYQDLLDIKVSLDLEIAAYRKLLEGEEERLNMSQSFTQSSVKSTPRKRRWTDLDVPTYNVEESETQSKSSYTSSGQVFGSVEIIEVNEEGKFVKVKNNSKEELPLGGWKLVQKVADNETDFKFHYATKLKSEEVATVWSADSGVTHDSSSHNFVMKGQKWVVGDLISTTLTDKEGKEQAHLELTKAMQCSIVKGTRRAAQSQATDPEAGKCSIM